MTQVASRSEVGNVREHNEDALLVDERADLYAVADGLGGHQAGEVASALAVETLRLLVTRESLDESDPGQLLGHALRDAHRCILDAARDDPEREGMGTTAVAVHLRDGEAWVAHVGDSRAYLVRASRAHQLTRDHGSGSYLTQALGTSGDVRPDVGRLEVRAGDRIVLCSDGLTDMLDDAELGEIASGGDEPQQACDALVEAALAAGGLDNVTVLVVQVGDNAPPQ